MRCLNFLRTGGKTKGAASKGEADGSYPSGEFVYKQRGAWENGVVKTKLTFALPWKRFRKGSVLKIHLRGEVTDQLKSFSRVLSLPQIWEALQKAAYDPRVPGIYLHIGKLSCGWGKLDEIRRHVLDFKKSGTPRIQQVAPSVGKRSPVEEVSVLVFNSRVSSTSGKNSKNSLVSCFSVAFAFWCRNGIREVRNRKVHREKRLRLMEVEDEGSPHSSGSGKFIIGYVPICGVKEYYIGCACDELYAPPSAYIELYGFHVRASFFGGVLEKVGIEAQVERIGKYKAVGDMLTRKNMSDENREMLTALLDNIHGNWLDTIACATGKEKEDIEKFINKGEYELERLKEESLITDIKYDDEVMSLLKERMGIPTTKKLPTVSYSKYCSVKKRTLGLIERGDKIAVIRASGEINQKQVRLRTSNSRIIAEQFIEKIRRVRESKKYKAVIIRIDSPGGYALASDLMWREIKLLADSVPVIASMSDLAASGGYYMAMAADVIVAENLTLTGSIGVVSAKINMQKLHKSIGFNKEFLSRGRYAEISAADNRPFRADEAELFAKRTQIIYNQFRNKAALSRSMRVDEMEKVAQGRVWTGRDALSLGLVDAIGGFSRAVAIAKQKANIPQERQVTLVELSKPRTSRLKLLWDLGRIVLDADEVVADLICETTMPSDAVQAKMDDILLEKLEGSSLVSSAMSLMKDHLRHY